MPNHALPVGEQNDDQRFVDRREGGTLLQEVARLNNDKLHLTSEVARLEVREDLLIARVGAQDERIDQLQAMLGLDGE